MHGMPISGQPALYVSIKQTGEQRKGKGLMLFHKKCNSVKHGGN